ncbi:MAG: hypothetical protein F6J93_26715 [Oscillatoria sp. SIO1A7]|nr:hypothetical protein [Oscillatoria sp. SIO1A7]
MIKSEHQYRVSTSLVEGCDRAIAGVERDEEKKKNEPYIWELHYKGAKAMKKMVLSEVEEYEALIKHDPSQPLVVNNPENVQEISDVLIKARIGLKITQKELAAICYRTEAEIASYEEKDYQNASFVDVIEVSTALGIKLKEGVYVAQMDDFCQERLEAVRKGDASEDRQEQTLMEPISTP